MIVIAVTIPVKPEAREEARQLFTVLEEATRQEAGCLSYTFYADRNDPNILFLFEEWASEEALANHYQTAHMKQFMPHAPTILAGAPSAKRYTVTAAAPLAV